MLPEESFFMLEHDDADRMGIGDSALMVFPHA